MYPIVSVVVLLTIFWIVSQTVFKRDNSYIDVMWGQTFILPIIVVWLLRFYYLNQLDNMPTVRMWLAFSLTTIWAMRLSIYLCMRLKGIEDYRYKKLREEWEAKGGICLYLIASFFVIFMLQAILSLIINASNLFIAIYSNDNDVAWTDFLGAAVWLAGFVIEVVADDQLARHLAEPRKPGEGKFLKKGLWRYSRHPNYFGEALLWYGIYIIACGIEYGWVTFFAPLTITLALRFLTGVPFPEEKYKDNAEWQQYCRETNVFIPWFASPEPEQQIQKDD